VPQVLDMDYVRTNLNSSRLKPYEIPVGIEYDTVEFVTINLLRTQMISITGREGSGKTNLMKVIFHYLYQGMFEHPVKAYIIDDYRRQLDCLSSYGIVDRYTIDSNDFETILGEMDTELQQRIEVLQTSGYEALKDYPLLLCVVQNSNIFTATGLTKNGLELFKNILKNYKQLKICFIFAEVDNVAAGYGAPELLKLVKDNKNIFAFENISNIKLLDMSMNILKQYKKEIELGDSYYITEKGIQKLKIIISKKEGQ
jgi:S-DNA-T family DNA segregation ATPase FtsK/SpoIIIE